MNNNVIDMESLDSDKYYVFCVNFSGLILANYLKLRGKYVEYIDNDKEKWNTEIVEQKCIAPCVADKSIPVIIVAQSFNSQKTIRCQLQELGFVGVFDLDQKWKEEWVDSYAPQMDDKLYLKIFWYYRRGTSIDIDHPTSFNEKIQWLKLHDQKKEYTMMADKYEAKQWVKNTIGEKYVIPTYGIFNSFDEIDFESLPSQFVMKTTHDSGGVEICTSKNNFDISLARKNLEYRLSYDYYYYEREYSYKGIKPRIIIEKYIGDDNDGELRDYKVFCFNGEPRIIEVDLDRHTNHRRNLYSTDWKLLDFSLCYPDAHNTIVKTPCCLDELLRVSRELSKGIPHVRVDFYIDNSRLFFGEMTFYHGGGYEVFDPPEWDYKLGQYITVV